MVGLASEVRRGNARQVYEFRFSIALRREGHVFSESALRLVNRQLRVRASVRKTPRGFAAYREELFHNGLLLERVTSRPLRRTA